MAVVSSGTAYADTVLPGNNGSYQVSASSAGLYLAIAGNQLTGGTSSASGTYNFASGASSPTETASATGQGFLLSTQLTGNPATANADSSKGVFSQTNASGTNGDPAGNGGTGGGNGDVGGPSYPGDCAQGGGQVQSGVGLFLGLGCGYAHAAVDQSAPYSGPQALGVGDIASASVSLQGILNQIYSGGASQLCTALGNIPQLGTDLLQPVCTQVLNSANPSLTLNLGNAYSWIQSSASKVEAISHGSSVDLSLFPGLDNGAEPLLRVEIPSATAVSCEGTGCTPPSSACSTTGSGASSGWTNWFDSGLIVITGTLLDDLKTLSGGSFPDPLEIPSCSQTSSGINQLNSSPLSQLLTLNLASANTTGSGVSGSGLEVSVLPTQGPGGKPVIEANLGGVNTSNTASGIATAANNVTTTTSGGLPAVPTAAGGSPTLVHTGEWWAGSLPLIGLLAALGGGLIAWPRMREVPAVARLVSRVSR